MSEPSTYDSYGSEEEIGGWSTPSENSFVDDDELTLLNGDEDYTYEDYLLDDDVERLSQELKRKYNLPEVLVELERCDKIWETMQLLRNIQNDDDMESNVTDEEIASSVSNYGLPEPDNSAVRYIKYQPVQGNGNNALPNFQLAVMSQKKVYQCVTCGKLYTEKRSLRLHSEKDHGIVLPVERGRRPKTPTDLNLRSGRNSVCDEKISQSTSNRDSFKSQSGYSLRNSTANSEENCRSELDGDFATDSFASRPNISGSKGSDQLSGVSYRCSQCEIACSSRQSLHLHKKRFHGTLSTDGNSTRVKRENSTFAEPKKEIPRQTRTSAGAASSSDSRGSSSKHSKNSTVKRESTNGRVDDSETPTGKSHPQKIINRHLVEINGTTYRRLFTCNNCGRPSLVMDNMRKHLLNEHGVTLPYLDKKNARKGIRRTLSDPNFTTELLRPDHQKILELKKKGRRPSFIKSCKASELIDRPQRSCALKTSYTECSKEEEEALQKTQFGAKVPPKATVKPSPEETGDCLLCKKSFPNIRKHLVVYHRINAIENVLSLTTILETEKNGDSSASKKSIDRQPQTVNNEMKHKTTADVDLLKKESSSGIYTRDSRFDSYIEPLGNDKYRCTVCAFVYNGKGGIERHLKRSMTIGKLDDHEAYQGWQAKKRRRWEKPKDPLALTDSSDSSRANSSSSNSNPSEDERTQSIARKRNISSSDERSTPSPASEIKRRKVENFTNFVDVRNGAESRTDSAEDNAEIESAQESSDDGSVEGTKSPDHRDTRDSSDRDSGIGISITIKKRNNSYEVVEKDSGDDEKPRNFVDSKDDDLLCSSDSSANVPTVDFVACVQDNRTHGIVNSIDCSKDESVLGSVRTIGDEVENENANERVTEDGCSSNVEDNVCQRRDGGFYRAEECTNLGGKVPSLKVLCRTVLTIVNSTSSE